MHTIYSIAICKMKIRMKPYITLLFLSLATLSLSAQTKRALLIGIGAYPAESGWATIHGDNDLEITSELLQEIGWTKSEIISLRNQEATKANIIQQFQQLAQTAEQGDWVYIHFSGHGQQMSNWTGDEADGWDEAWIPYDAQKVYAKGKYEGENHLADDEINGLLSNIKQQIGASGSLIVVVDACHSGDSSRAEDEDETVMRGVSNKFEIPQQTNAQSKLMPIDWVVISACKPYMNNYECRIEGQHFGSLSYALYAQRSEISSLSLSEIQQRTQQLLSSYIPMPQSIMVESPASLSNQRIFKKQ